MEHFSPCLKKIISIVLRKEIDISFRRYLLTHLPFIMPSFETLNELIKGFVEYENYDLQEYIGVCLVRLAKRIDKTEWIIKEGVEGVKKQTLVGKRNWGVWLYKLVEKYGNTLESVK